jgi:hypothetical protein
VLIRGLGRVSARPASKPSTVIALALAVAVAIAGALLWGLVAMLFNLQLSLLGLLLGAGVGVVVARYRVGHLPTMITGAGIAVAGCALGTFLGMVFKALDSHVPLSYILGHLTGQYGLLHYFPGEVGVLGLLFWAVAAYAAIRIPLQNQRPTLAPFTGVSPAGPGLGQQSPGQQGPSQSE